jgi:peptidoglycan/xylan/chitin deacetylase (PgdA/CDA1 family)
MNEHLLSRRDLLAGTAGVALGVAGIALPSGVGAASMVAISGVRGVVSSPDGVLNLRGGPGTQYEVLGQLKNGSGLSITNTSGDWFKVTSGGRTGWVNSWYVTLTGSRSVAIRRGNTTRKQVALTFDCGSDYGYTDLILGTLDEHAVPASFSFTGDWLESYSETAARIVKAGYQVINHTLSHPSFTGLSTPGTGPRSPAKRLSQIQANEVLIGKLTGTRTSPYWRPPYGDIDSGVLRDVGALGYTKTAMWTIDSLGWNKLSADQIYWRVMNNMVWGAIVLMHVGIQSQDGNALDRVIRGLKSAGYSFGTFAQVIA